MIDVNLTFEQAKSLIDYCQSLNVKLVKCGGFEVEFFPKAPQPMSFDPKELAKTLSDSMPPDSAMLFASSEDFEQPQAGLNSSNEDSAHG